MPRSFEVSVESPVNVEQVGAALRDRVYWLARLATFTAGSTLTSLTVDDNTVHVTVTQDLRRDVLPGVLSSLYRRDLTIAHTETWRSTCDGQLHGDIDVAVSGAPGSGHGAAVVVPSNSGSRMTLSGTVTFNVPLVGGRMESFVAREFARGIPDIQHFTTEWIGEHV